MKREFNEDHTPLGYLVAFRAYGTWLHGDERGSIDRHHNHYGAPLIPPNQVWVRYNKRTLKHDPVRLTKQQRALINNSIEQTCNLRGWRLYKTNVRTNHVHVVIAAACGPSRILNALKSNATQSLREAGYWQSPRSPWADRGSKRYLWSEAHVQKAIDYVKFDQGDVIPSLDELDD